MNVDDIHMGTWQEDYEKATGNTGKVVEVYGSMGGMGSLALFVKVKEGDAEVFYSPYLNQEPEADHIEDSNECCCEECQFERDQDEWVVVMSGATNWGEWDWGRAYDNEPAH